ncbi:hypothetical protein KL943_005076 [Ogataea angusta]|nr:hypothetical protein KL943_005076 [Ogataea angusta]
MNFAAGSAPYPSSLAATHSTAPSLQAWQVHALEDGLLLLGDGLDVREERAERALAPQDVVRGVFVPVDAFVCGRYFRRVRVAFLGDERRVVLRLVQTGVQRVSQQPAAGIGQFLAQRVEGLCFGDVLPFLRQNATTVKPLLIERLQGNPGVVPVAEQCALQRGWPGERWQQRRVHVETRVLERFEEGGRDQQPKGHSHADVELAPQPVEVCAFVGAHKRQTCLAGVSHDERFPVLSEPAAAQFGRPCNHGDSVGVLRKQMRQTPDRKLV